MNTYIKAELNLFMTFYQIVPLRETVGIQRNPERLPDFPAVAYTQGVWLRV